MMKVASYDQRIAFERATETIADSGAISTEWEQIATCWAWVMSIDGQEFNESNKLVGTHTWKIRTRRREDITRKDRILYDGKYLYVSSISHDSSRSEVTEFLCSEYPS